MKIYLQQQLYNKYNNTFINMVKTTILFKIGIKTNKIFKTQTNCKQTYNLIKRRQQVWATTNSYKQTKTQSTHSKWNEIMNKKNCLKLKKLNNCKDFKTLKNKIKLRRKRIIHTDKNKK